MKKLVCTIEDEVRDYIRKNENLRFSEITISDSGFIFTEEDIFSPVIDSDEIIEMLRFAEIEAKLRDDL